MTEVEGDRPVLIVVAGPNGSGKTELTTKILGHNWADGCEYINPDLIARDKFGDWNDAEAVMQAAKAATEMRYRLLDERKSIAFETVFSSSEKVDFLRIAKERGYFVRIFFVGTDSPEINASRVARRVLEGGHDVPIPKIISRYAKSIANLAEVIAEVDRAYVYDNSIDNKPARLQFRTFEGEVVKIYDQGHEWAVWLYDFLDV
ncbi:zeta toxin family protein [Paracoccus litorisediminis]|uniref:zeta toxin family protein n=1 Tax=Paracoccus litorisediminis TaxID=2006130 RepID=UPI00372F6EAD